MAREAGEHIVEDKDFDIGLGLLFLPEAIEFCQSGLDRRQKISACLLDPLARCFVQVVLLKRSNSASSSSRRPSRVARFCSSSRLFNQFDETPEGLLDRCPVLLAVVVGDDLLVLALSSPCAVGLRASISASFCSTMSRMS